MATAYTMPKLAMAMSEGTINEWLVKQGEWVEKAQPLVTVETEKVVYDCESPEEGYLNIVVAQGQTVPCETIIGYFCESEAELAALKEESPNSPLESVDSESPTQSPQAAQEVEPEIAAPPETPAANTGRIIASPLARKIASDRGLDLARIKGTGPKGRIVKRDVAQALASGVSASVPPQIAVSGNIERVRIPIKGIRKTIADRLLNSMQNSAQVSAAWESDITTLLDVRQAFVEREHKLGTRVSVNAFIVKAIISAIKQVPVVNACTEGEELVVYENINMGIAVAMPGKTEYDSSLMVAVLRNVERMGVVEIDREMKTLISRVRSGDATPEDLSGSTITLSSTAGIAPPGSRFTPVLNSPNLVLVGSSTPLEKPAVHNGKITPRTLMPMYLTFDHRFLDGEPASRFMHAIHECLESPALMLA